MNSTDCIKSIHNIGSITYHNICNGHIATLPWGALAWLVAAYILVLSAFSMMGGFRK